MAINFTDSPADGATQVIGGRTYTYNSAKNKWDTTATEVVGPTATVYATVNDLPGTATTGDQAFVSGTNRLYIWNGSGWYNIALINTNPTISGVSSSYDLATDGTATTITITATDPEGLPITYSIASDTSGNIATVTQGTGASSNVFTITPSTNDANAGTFTLTFRASDGVNIATAPASFTLEFKILNSNYTTALITSVGTNNQVNNDFVDSSTNSHTITAAGNVTQSTFSPYRHGGYSLYFDGATVMDLGFSTLNSGNWTFECWVICEQGETIVGKYNGGNQLEAFGISNTTGYMYTHTGVGVETPTCVTDLRDGQWHYCVWERYNGTYYYWADGSLEASFANTEAPSGGGNWGMGGVASGRFKGYVKEARLSLSTAVYSGNAPTVPTEPQTTSNSTDAFFTGVGVEIKDYSSNNRTFTLNTTQLAPKTPYDYAKYNASNNGGSMYFDGTGDYLTSGTSASLALGSGDFTFECWVYPPSASVPNYAGIYSNTSDGINDSNALRFGNVGTDATTLIVQTAASTIFQSTTGVVKVGQWNHCALVRSGTGTNNMTIYVNGVASGSGTSTANFSTGYATVGTNVYNTVHYLYSGYIADVRVVSGTAVYTSDFTPPTAPLTAITNTSLLLSGTNAGIIDKSQSVKTITLNGDVKSSTTQSKYLTSSMYFDGTGDSIATNLDDTLPDDFTLECWIYASSAWSNYRTIFDSRINANAADRIFVGAFTTSGEIHFYTTTTIIKATNVPDSQWVHLAISRESGTLKMFIDGTLAQSASSITQAFYVPRLIGNSFDDYGWQGYLSDVRVTNGLARYTSNFTPPTAALQG